MSQINVTVVGSTAESTLVSAGQTISVTFADQAGGGGTGAAATIEVGSVTTVSSTESASVVNSGTAYAAKLDFKIPRGAAAGLSIGTVTAGTAAAATITGSAGSQVLSLTLPPGPPNSLSIGTVESGTAAAATITGSAGSQVLSLTLPQGSTGVQGPQGEAGPATTISIGTVTGGTAAAATISGAAPSQVLSLVLPAGAKGDSGPYTTIAVGKVTTGSPGTSAAITSTKSGDTVTLDFTIPAGQPGSLNLADETPQPLGAASAGTALTAARADHIHAVPTIAYSSLSGIPSTFTPAAHTQAISTITGLQAALDGLQPAGTYATLVNGTVPSSQLPGFVDDIVEYANLAGFPGTGEVGKLFVARDTNKVYRWSGSTYVEISASPGSTDAVPEGSTNLYFTTKRAADAAPVQSVNSLTGALTVQAGDNVTVLTSGTAITVSATAAGIGPDDAVDGGNYVGEIVTNTPTITIATQPANQTATTTGGTLTYSEALTGENIGAFVRFNGTTIGTDATYWNKIYTRTTGSWTSSFLSGTANSTSFQPLRSLAATDSRVVMASLGDGQRTIRYSTDGTTWNAVTNTFNPASLAASSSRFVACGEVYQTDSGVGRVRGQSAQNLHSSDDGASWTAISTGAISGSNLGYAPVFSSVAWTGSRFVAVGCDLVTYEFSSGGVQYTNLQFRPVVAYSASGLAWTAASLPHASPPAAAMIPHAIAHGAGRLVAVGALHTTYAQYAAGGSGGLVADGYPSKTLGKAMGTATQDIFTSTDNGSTWTKVANALPLSQVWTGITYADGKWIATCNDSSYYAVSTDGLNWTDVFNDVQTTPDLGYWSSAWDGSAFLISGSRTNVGVEITPAITGGTLGAIFSVSATVSPSAALSYQWEKSDDDGSTWAAVSGATSSSLSLSSLTTGADDGDQYRVVVSASGATPVTSSAATLTVP